MKQLKRGPSELVDARRMPQQLAPQPYPEFESTQPWVSPSHYLLVLFRQKWKILGFVATCVLVTYLVSSRLTPVYEATAKIDVDRSVPAGVIGQEANQGSSDADADAFLSTQVELIQSDAVLRPVADRFNLLQRESQLEKLPAESARKK